MAGPCPSPSAGVARPFAPLRVSRKGVPDAVRFHRAGACRGVRRPGHGFPLRYAQGGVLRRPGHTEASVDLARLAGLRPAAVICEVVNDDGTMKRLPDLAAFAAQNGLALVSIADLIDYRRRLDRQ